jgi:hypothetical protein
MNDGMSMPVGQAWMQGASKQNRQRLASIKASCGVNRGAISAMFALAASGPSFGLIGITKRQNPAEQALTFQLISSAKLIEKP